MMTASWWPWYEFALHSRVPATSFRPVPSVDGGLFTATRRDVPLVANREPYQRFVHQVFTGRGRGVADILVRTARVPRPVVRTWEREQRVGLGALPKDLTAHQWASLWNALPDRELSVRHKGSDASRRVRAKRRGITGPSR